MDKSGQFSLYLCHPDDMEVPKPVSDLIHDDTMEAGGDYYEVRMT